MSLRSRWQKKDKLKNDQANSEGYKNSLEKNREVLWSKNFVFIWIMNFSTFGWAIMLNATFPFYIIHLGGDELLVGIAAAGFAITSLVMRPLSGWILDNKTRGGLLRVGLILLMGVTILYIALPILGVAVAIRIIGGLIFAGVTTSTQTNAADSIPKSRFGEGLGLLGLSNTIATAIAPAIGLMLISGQDFTLLFVVLICVLMIAIFMERGIKYRKVEKKEVKFFNKQNLLSLFNKDSLPAALVMMLMAAPFGGITAFVALYGEIYGLGFGGIYFILVASGSGISRIALRRVIDRKGEKPMILMGSACVLTGLMMLLLDNTVTYYLAGFLTGSGIGVTIPAMKSMALRIVKPERRGSATATFLCAFDLSGGIGAFTAGAVVTLFGYRMMFASLSLFTIFAFLLYFLWASKTPSAFVKSRDAQ